MILVTVGTNEQPFDRLVRAAATLDVEEPLIVQYGSSQVPHGPGQWVDFLSFDELADLAREARVVVSHAGVGSIMLVRRCGHRPVVVARRRALAEAVDDHQHVLARRLERAGLLTLVEREAALRGAVRMGTGVVSASDAVVIDGAQALGAEVRDVLAGLGAARFSRAA